jgi:hypothetical protein
MAEICFRSKSDEHGGQIYTSLIVYLILKLGEIPKELAEKPVDKLPYLLQLVRVKKSALYTGLIR